MMEATCTPGFEDSEGRRQLPGTGWGKQWIPSYSLQKEPALLTPWLKPTETSLDFEPPKL